MAVKFTDIKNGDGGKNVREKLNKVIRSLINEKQDTNVSHITLLGKYNPYLYEVLCPLLDYDYAKSHIGQVSTNAFACTSFKKGGLVGRNFDWKYDNSVEFIVRSEGVVGVAGCIPNFDTIYMQGEWQTKEESKLIPFFLQDGVNTNGVFASVHVVKNELNDTERSIPTEALREEMPSLMLVRYILDHFTSAREAVEYIRDYVSILSSPTLREQGYDLHWFIADKESSYVLEVIEGEVHIIEKDAMTNFYWYGVTPKEDGTLYSVADVPTHRPTTESGLTLYAQGVERYNLIAKGEDDLAKLAFSSAYNNVGWYSEFVGGDLTIDSASSAFAQILTQAKLEWEHRNRETAKVWHTKHSCVYDLENLSMKIITQDGDDTISKEPVNILLLGFDINKVATSGVVRFDQSQTLTEPQKKQARINIGAASDADVVHKTGDESIGNKKTFTGTAEFERAVRITTPNGKLEINNATDFRSIQIKGGHTLQQALDAKVTTEQMTAAILVEKQRAKAIEGELFEIIVNEAQRAVDTERELHNEILTEQGRAQGAEAELSARIDAIVQGRDVRDIVPNYQALLDYDTTTLGDNDIIMVLLDNTKSDHTTYYRWHTDTQSWEFIGGLAFTYTKTEIDQKFADLHIVLPVFNEQSSQELLAQVDETIRHAGDNAQFKLPIPVEGMSGNVTVTYVKYNPAHTYLGVFADDRSELYHITRTLTSPRTYTCEVITKVFATADALASLIKDLYNADPAEGEELGDIPRIDQALADKEDKIFVATHNRTTYNEIVEAYEAGREVVCKYGNRIYHLTVCTFQRAIFNVLAETVSNHTLVCLPNNSWSYTGTNLENSARRQSVITDSDTNYPSSKAVVDYVAEKAPSKEQFNSLADKVEDIQLFRTPNVSVYGAPRFDHGQASDFSRENYLGMPFKFDVVNQRFELTLAFVMGADVATTQNIMGSNFSLAFFVSQGKLNVRVSSNGTGWNIIEWEYTDKTLEANHPYFVKLAFSGIRYSVELSENGTDYTEIYGIGSNQFPFARLLYLGIGNNFNNPFLGAINLNKCLLTIGNDIYWEGMISGGIPEAPEDNKGYIRKNGEWHDVDVKIATALPSDNIPADNTIYNLGEVATLVIAGVPTDNTLGAVINFHSGTTATQLQYPAASKWNTDTDPTIDADSDYQLTLLDHVFAIAKISTLTQE